MKLSLTPIFAVLLITGILIFFSTILFSTNQDKFSTSEFIIMTILLTITISMHGFLYIGYD